jgi:hypothetical protein
MKKTVTYITTADTKKTYAFPTEKDKKNPQLWMVELRMNAVDGNLGYSSIGSLDYSQANVYLERETLEKVGLVGKRIDVKEDTPPKETVEDLIIRMCISNARLLKK